LRPPVDPGDAHGPLMQEHALLSRASPPSRGVRCLAPTWSRVG